MKPRSPDTISSVAVIDFHASKDVSGDAGRALADICRDALLRSGQFRVLDRERVRAILGEQDFGLAMQCDNTNCLVQYGRMLSAKQMVTGRLSRLGQSYVLYMSLTDIDTSRLVSTTTATARGNVESLLDLVPQKTFELVVNTLGE